MSDLNEYLQLKRGAVQAVKAAALAPGYEPTRLRADVTAEGRSGVRRIRIREFQVLTDSPPAMLGYDLGPSSPELALAALGSCLTHSYLIQAAVLGVPITTLSVTVTGQIDARAGQDGHAGIPVHPHDLAYTVQIDSPASEQDLAGLFEAVERSCPILNLLRRPQAIAGSVRRAAERPTTTVQENTP
jgi:uncharacterized OsmC-like protein